MRVRLSEGVSLISNPRDRVCINLLIREKWNRKREKEEKSEERETREKEEKRDIVGNQNKYINL